MKPRIRDIAAAAGVSPATVSNVFNGRKGVGPAMQQHIFEVARKMGYTREAASQGPRNCIRFVMIRKHGLIIMDTPFFSQMIDGIEQACRRSGHELIMTSISLRDQDAMDRVSTVVNDAQTPFILLATELDDDYVRLFQDAKAPMVAMDRDCSALGIHSVTLDNQNAGITAAKILMRNGHRRIGYLGSAYPFQNDDRRRTGLEIALRESGLSLNPDDIFRLEPTMDGSFRDMRAALSGRQRGDLPSAFFCMNDLIAAGANRALKETGYRLPDDISLVGMDDLPICSIIHPQLSSINVDKTGFGALAVHQLLYVTDNKPERALVLTPGAVAMERDSVMNLNK